MIQSYLKIAVRQLWRSRLYSLLNIFGLALGVVCSLVIFICIRYELTFDKFHSSVDQLYRVVEHHHTSDGVQYWNSTAYPMAAALRQDFPNVEVAQTAGPINHVISANEDGVVNRFDEKQVLFADPYFLKLFDFKKAYANESGLWLAGNPQTALLNPNSVVLTQRLVSKYFPKTAARHESIVGKTLVLNNKDILTVTGVIRNPPANTSLVFDLLIPYQFYKQKNSFYANNWAGNYQGTTYVLLKNQTASVLEKNLVSFKKKYLSPEDNKRNEYFLQPVHQIHTETRYGNSINSYVVNTSTLWALASLGAFLLLIACINFINLSTARAAKRIKEVGVRKVVGGTRSQLITQLLTETLLIASVAVVLALMAINYLLDYLNKSLSFISLQLTADPTILGIGLLLLLLITLLAGFYPAFVLSGYKPVLAVSRAGNQPSQKSFLRQSLIVVQFAIAQLLIVGTIVIANQMQFIHDKDLGFTKEAIVVVPIPNQQPEASLSTLRQRWLQNPAIRQVSFSSGAPTATSTHFGTNFRLAREPETMMRSAEMKVADTAYLNLYNLKLVAGRWINRFNLLPDSFNGFVVNEALVSMLGLQPQEAIGKQIIINEGQAPIVGVVRNFHNNSLQEGVSPCVFFGNADFFGEASIQLLASDENPATVSKSLAFIEKTWKDTFPEEIYSHEFLSDTLAKSYFVENLAYKAVRFFSTLAIFIACLGLFGLAAFTTEQRTKEIGVRKVLGASVGSIVTQRARL